MGTADNVKAILHFLIDMANNATGESDTDLSSAVENLVADYGYDEGYAQGVEQGVVEGKQAEYDAFWDVFQQKGRRTNYWAAFAYWYGENFPPKYPLTALGTHNYLFRGAEIDEVPPIGFDDSQTGVFQIFYGAVVKTATLILTERINYFGDVFYGASPLENLTIEGVIAGQGFDVHWSTRLIKASIISIVNALSTSTSGLTVTLSLVAVKKAFETAEGANDGNTSAEWTNLAATKTNWTISLI